ncbi:hypothetical protein VMCG_05691 [Cytospora schulzeri]|uniref:Uncharacterized protein n=1 Tax=Cytospora schulzeri TaxID=448051 RepID=A0A423WI99_9PEZI|nr:hypothetical protein VMCG_05691 [Valsa malicola]
MRLTASTTTAHYGEVEIRGVQRVMEFEATDHHSHHHHANRTSRRGQQPSEAVTPAQLDAVQSRTVIVVPCKDEPLDRILSVWAGIPPGSLILSVSGSADEAAYAAERDALAAFCRDTGRSGMCVWQRDPKLAGALRGVGLTALLDGDEGLVHKGKGEALVIGIALAAVARGPDGSGDLGGGGGGGTASSRSSSSSHGKFGRERDSGIGGGQDTELLPCDGLGGNQQQAITTTSTTTRRGNGQEHAGSNSPRRGRSRGTCQQQQQEDGSDKGGSGGEEEGDGEDTSSNGTRTGFYKYIGFVDADNFVPGSVQEYCKAFSSGLHLATAEDAMVRISWGSKPKVKDGNIEFKKSGRSSEIVNRWFNRLLQEMRGGDYCTFTDDLLLSEGGGGVRGEAEAEAEAEAVNHICTGNAGEHAMTISLALKLRLASGYAIEPFHFLDIFERFAGGDNNKNNNNHDSNNNSSSSNKVVNSSPSSSPEGRRATDSPPRAASLPELGSSPISSMSSSPLPTPMDCSPVLSASTPAGPSTALTDISTLPLPPPFATVEATMRAMYNSKTKTKTTTKTSTKVKMKMKTKTKTFSSTLTSAAAAATGTARPVKPASGKVQILQVRTMNPHFHDTSKGESHIAKMWMQGLSAIYHSPVTAGLPGYRDALRDAILEGKSKLEGRAGPLPLLPAPAARMEGDDDVGGGGGDDDWEPERCRVYPAPADFNLLKLRDMLEASEGSFWWSGMDGEDDDGEYDDEEEEEEEEEEELVDDLPQEEEEEEEETPNVDFGLDGCPYGISYRTHAAIMEFLQDSSSPSGELQLQLPPADAVVVQNGGAFQGGRQDFPLPQRDFGMVVGEGEGGEEEERDAVRGKMPKDHLQQQGGANIWYPCFYS